MKIKRQTKDYILKEIDSNHAVIQEKSSSDLSVLFKKNSELYQYLKTAGKDFCPSKQFNKICLAVIETKEIELNQLLTN